MFQIGIIATLDTKGAESAYLKKCIESEGHKAIVLDSGLMSEAGICPDISRHEILRLAGVESLDDCRLKGKAALQKAMTEGLKKMVKKLYDEGKIQGILSIGGAQGTAMSAAAMQVLPIGFPKVIVSTIACGQTKFGDYVGNRDIVMIPSIVDICGINSVTVPVLASGAGAVMGMAGISGKIAWKTDKPVVGLTMAGVTTKCVMRVKDILEGEGYETIVCHCNVVGAEVLDEMAAKGRLDGVIDITPHDVGGFLFDGLMQCKERRFENIYKCGIPVITVPGAVDFMLKGPVSEIPDSLKNRAMYEHTPFHTHIRADYEEMYKVGRYLTERHNGCAGPNAMMIPVKGYSQQNQKGKLLYDEKANLGFADAVLENKNDNVVYISSEMHINDPEFAAEIVRTFKKLQEVYRTEKREWGVGQNGQRTDI